jgi:hypothetical protein
MKESESLLGAHLYFGTPAKLDRYLIGALGVKYEDFTFVDLGSGKGRALFVAADFPFREIIGVEFVGELHEAAEKNIDRYSSSRQKCTNISAHCQDATEFAMPETPLVLHLAHPFKKESRLLQKLISNLEASLSSNPRPVRIIYVHHLYKETKETFARFPFLRGEEGIEFLDPFWNSLIYTNDLG